MNKTAKGKRIEREFEKILKSYGFLTWKPTWNKYYSKDVFNIADIIAISSKKGCEGVYFIQVKSNKSDFYKARKKMRDFITSHKLNMFKDVIFVVVYRVKKDIWRLHIFKEEVERDNVKNLRVDNFFN